MEKILKHIFALSVIFTFVNIQLSGQVPTILRLDSPDGGPQTYRAKQLIELLPGYLYDGETSGYSMDAYINTSLSNSGYISMEDIIDNETRELDLSLQPGSTPGNFNVSGFGAATYSVPIMVPPGSAGMQPSVAIGYSSQGGNGLLGLGWNLMATSAITRTGKNIYYDDDVKGINLTNDDHFVWNGQRLILLSGTHGETNAVYTTEFGATSRITITSHNSYGPLSFTVDTKNGPVLYYGSETDSRFEVDDIDAVISWYLKKVEDPVGNYMIYNYTRDTENCEIWLESIEYTGNQAESITPYNKVEFHYRNREDENHLYYGGDSEYNQMTQEYEYIPGYRRSSTKLLWKIRTLAEGTSVREYVFDYYTDGFNSFLHQIYEFNAYGEFYNPIVINWGDNATEDANRIMLNQSLAAVSSEFAFGDFNGDGKTDIMVIRYHLDGSNNQVYDMAELFYLNNYSTFSYSSAQQISLGSATGKQIFKALDYNGDGLEDLIRIDGLNDEITLYKSNGSTLTITNLDISFSGISDDEIDNYIHIADFDGDGKGELMVQGSSSYNLYDIADAAGNNVTVTTTNISVGSGILNYTYDFNGDGKSELSKITSEGKFQYFESSTDKKLYENRFFETVTGLYFGDFNGDGSMGQLGYRDILGWYITSSTMYAQNKVFMTLPSLPDLDIVTSENHQLTTGDYNGDGKSDICHLYYESNTLYADIYYSKGTEFTDAVTVTIGALKMDSYTFPSFRDFNGDGIEDLFLYNWSSTNPAVHAEYVVLMNQDTEHDLVKSISNGNNVKHSIDYSFLSQNFNGAYTKGGGGIYPNVYYSGPMPVVENYTTECPDCDDETVADVDFSYTNFRINREGMGILGLNSRTVSDNIQNRKSTVTYSFLDKAHGYHSYPQHSYLNRLDNDQPLAYTNSKDTVEIINNVTSTPLKMVYNRYTKNEDKLNNTLAVNKVETIDDYGNITQQTEKYYLNASLGTASQIPEATVVANNTYIQINGTCLNKVSTSSVTKSRPGETNYSRSTRFTYYNSGLPEHIYADEGTNYVTQTDFVYNNFGNVTSKTFSGTSVTTRTYYFGYDNKGRFNIWVTNPLAHGSSSTYDSKYGNVLTSSDANGLTTTYEYNRFGMPETVTTPFGTGYSTVNWNTNGSVPDALYVSIAENATGEYSETYYDALGRVILNKGLDGKGRELYSNTEYNPKGMVESVEEAHFDAETPRVVTCQYDPIGRLTRKYGTGFDIGYSYDVRKMTTTNNLNPLEETWQMVNSMGEIIQSKDEGGDVFYLYYASGLPDSVISPSGTISMQYNLQGNRTQLNDPNAGVSSYVYNAFGEMTQQTDARGNVYTMQYDVLGRITQLANTTEGTTTYQYVTSGNALGAIQQISNSTTGISQQYTYNALSQLTSTTETIESTQYTYNFTYDDYGRVTHMDYPESFAVNYIYNAYNMAEQLNDGQGNMIWQLSDLNSRGQVTSLQLGNGVTTTLGYDANGFTNSIVSNNGSTNVQQLGYVWNGNTHNLTSRTDYLANSGSGITESFTYDTLNRLKTYSHSGQTFTMQYHNPTGNITGKSDVGTLTYSGVSSGPNAVTGVIDNNGVISTDNQQVTYTAFNKISGITEGLNEIYFTYGVNNARKITEQYLNSVLTKKKVFVGLYEKEIDGQSNVRHLYYIPGPTGTEAVYVKINSQDGEMYYVHKDHLGSIQTVTDENGDIAQVNGQDQVYAFDPWGRRRNPNTWALYASTPANLLFDRGFTGHEHLDAFALINMNGRVYDPALGRFLSPDPFVQNTSGTQSYNRYSYALSNPLKYTDPSGYALGYDYYLYGSTRITRAMHEGGGSGYGSWDWLTSGKPMYISDYEASLCIRGNQYSDGFYWYDEFGSRVGKFDLDIETGNKIVTYDANSEASKEWLATIKLLEERGWYSTQKIEVWTDGMIFAPLFDINFDINIGPSWVCKVIYGFYGKVLAESFEDDASPNTIVPTSVAGISASVLKEMYYSKTFKTWMGKNYKLYKQQWGGNGITGGKYKFAKKTSNTIKWAGRVISVYSTYNTIEQRVNHEIGTGWMLAEFGTTAVSNFGGIYGAAWGVGWELGRTVTNMGWYQEAKFNYWHDRWESKFGPPSQSNEELWNYFYQNYKP